MNTTNIPYEGGMNTNFNKPGFGAPIKMGKALPDDFHFRQNEGRTDDLEVEERALMNLAAQEID